MTSKELKQHARQRMLMSPDKKQSWLYGIGRLIFMYIAIYTILIGVNSITTGDYKLWWYQIIAIISLMFMVNFEQKLLLSSWTQPKPSQFKTRTSAFESIMNGTFRMCYVVIGIMTGIIPFAIASIINSNYGVNIWVIIMVLISLAWSILAGWFVNALYLFTPIEAHQYLLGTDESRKASRKYMFKYWKAYLKVAGSFLGWDVINLLSFGLISPYLIQYKSAVQAEFRREHK